MNNLIDEAESQKKSSFLVPPNQRMQNTENELIIPRSVPSLWKIPVFERQAR
jgi:hypothetical protein